MVPVTTRSVTRSKRLLFREQHAEVVTVIRRQCRAGSPRGHPPVRGPRPTSRRRSRSRATPRRARGRPAGPVRRPRSSRCRCRRPRRVAHAVRHLPRDIRMDRARGRQQRGVDAQQRWPSGRSRTRRLPRARRRRRPARRRARRRAARRSATRRRRSSARAGRSAATSSAACGSRRHDVRPRRPSWRGRRPRPAQRYSTPLTTVSTTAADMSTRLTTFIHSPNSDGNGTSANADRDRLHPGLHLAEDPGRDDVVAQRHEAPHGDADLAHQDDDGHPPGQLAEDRQRRRARRR